MFRMLGYDPARDLQLSGQTELLGFEFDDFARQISIDALMEQIPAIVYAHDEGISFGELFATI